MLAQQYIVEGGLSAMAKDLLEKDTGAPREQGTVIGKLSASLQVRPFEFCTQNRCQPAS